MKINFIEEFFSLTGLIIDEIESDIAPEIGDRVKIGKEFYIVNDRIFDIGKKSCLNVYLDKISKNE